MRKPTTKGRAAAMELYRLLSPKTKPIQGSSGVTYYLETVSVQGDTVTISSANRTRIFSEIGRSRLKTFDVVEVDRTMLASGARGWFVELRCRAMRPEISQ